MDFVTERWIEARDARLFLRGWGDDAAPAVLFWHGVSLTSLAGLTLAVAGEQFARDHGLRALALDAPGFGRSPALEPAAYDPHSLADLVPPLLDALGVERAAFMGFSWGGDVGCHVAARHPKRLTALVLLDAGYRDPPFDPLLPYEAYLERNEAKARELPAVSVPPEVVAAVEHGIAQALPSTTRARLAESGVPVLLVASAEARRADLDRFAVDVPQAEILRPEGAGHDVLGDGGPELVRSVGRWLSRSRS